MRTEVIPQEQQRSQKITADYLRVNYPEAMLTRPKFLCHIVFFPHMKVLAGPDVRT